MTNDKKAILAILSRILDYPEHSFMEEKPSIEQCIRLNIQNPVIRKEVQKRIQPLYDIPLQELQQLYVETFDRKEETNLYLTSHEMGDSRKRGAALIYMQKFIHDNGFEYAGRELADYIPMLLELLAVIPASKESALLEKRMAYAIHRILKNLPEENIFYKPIETLLLFVLEKPASADVSNLEKLRVKADLEELPYPMMYR